MEKSLLTLSVLFSLAALILSAYAAYRFHHALRFLTVRKLVLVDETGTPRLIMAAGDQIPGPVVRGRVYPAILRGGSSHNTAEAFRPAVIVFLNDEGTEQGGIVWFGRKTRDGWAQMWRFSLDPYLQNEIFSFRVDDVNGKRAVRVDLMDHPVDPEGFVQLIERLDQAFAGSTPDQEQLAAINRWIEERYGDRWWIPRMEMARDEKGRLLLRWRDTTGNVCLEAVLEGDALTVRRGCTVQPEEDRP